MFPINDSNPSVISAREELKAFVESEKQLGTESKEIASKVSSRTYGSGFGFDVMGLFNDTVELANFIGLEVSDFDCFFMS